MKGYQNSRRDRQDAAPLKLSGSDRPRAEFGRPVPRSHDCPECNQWYAVLAEAKADPGQRACGHGLDKERAIAIMQKPGWVWWARAAQDAEDKAEAEAEAKAAGPLAMLDDVIGNAGAVMQIRTALDAHISRQSKAAKGKGPAFPHMLLSGPGGCVKGDTRIFDPMTGAQPTIESLCQGNIRPWVMTIHGPERADVPFLKGYADLYEVLLASGRRVTVQKDHRFLSPAGWRKMCELRPGDAIAVSDVASENTQPCGHSRPLSTSGMFPSARQTGACRCSDKAPDSQERYSACSYPCGEQPQTLAAAGQEAAPSQADAGEPCLLPRLGGQERGQERTHPHLQPRRPSMQDCSRRQGCRESKESPTRQSCHAHDGVSPQASPPCESGIALGGNTPQSAADASPIVPFDDPSHFASVSPIWSRWDKVESIIRVAENQPFYDITVPMAQHYLAEGIWHHNTGKTMLAEILARELGGKLHLQMGQVLSNPVKVAECLQTLRRGDVLFIDEIAGLKPACQEALYRAMEDRKLVPATKAGDPPSRPVNLAPFTIIGATTDEWALLPSMCQRFKYRVRLQRLSAPELSAAIAGRAERLGLVIAPEAADMIGSRSLGTPRLAAGLLDGCIDTAEAQGETEITEDTVKMTTQIWGIDSLGLDKVARSYLRMLADAGGQPVRLNVLASKLDGLSKTTVERKIEPDLVFLGLIEKRPDGRVLLPAGKEHLRKETR